MFKQPAADTTYSPARAGFVGEDDGDAVGDDDRAAGAFDPPPHAVAMTAMTPTRITLRARLTTASPS
ncbi:MAG: hypothetical protein ACXVD2_07140 [Actinomycetota bacterium]